MKVKSQSEVAQSLSRVRLFATPWTAAYQAPPSMEFSRLDLCPKMSSVLENVLRALEKNVFCCFWVECPAAAKSLQSCPTLCDPIDGSPPGSPVPGILQARTLEWVAISFSNA